jgi:DNA-binding NarL/FixJ family response regulator
MANTIVSKPKHPIPEMFTYLGVDKITPKDKFSIDYAEGFLTATINRNSGSVEVIRRHITGGFTEATSFDPSTMDKSARDEVIIKLRNDGFSQSEIARRIGFTQATVSNVLRRTKRE